MNLRPILVVAWLWLVPHEAAHAQDNRFHEELIADGFGYAFAAADLDADGDLDIAATAERGTNELRLRRNRAN
jgi:hypothetical protein